MSTLRSTSAYPAFGSMSKETGSDLLLLQRDFFTFSHGSYSCFSYLVWPCTEKSSSSHVKLLLSLAFPPPRLCWATYLGKLCGGGFCVCFLTFPNYETIDSYNVLSGYSHAVLTWLLVGQQPFSCDSAWELPLGVLVSPDLCSLPLQTSKQGMLASGVPGLRAPKTRSRITTPNHHPYADTLLCILGVAQILH